MARLGPKTSKLVYGLEWPKYLDSLEIEFQMCRAGGYITGKSGTKYGEGLFHHYRAAMKLMWPQVVWHKWNNLIVEHYVKKEVRTIAILGPASSGKTHTSALCGITDYFIWPDQTTVIVCSTTKELLEQRVFGEIKRLWRSARKLYSWLPGNLIEGRLRIVTDSRDEFNEGDGRDFINGVLGVPVKK